MSLAKQELRELLETDTDGYFYSMDAANLQKKSQLFQAYPPQKFKEYLKNLKERIRLDKLAVRNDELFLQHDMNVVKSKKAFDRGYPQWHLHKAKDKLRVNVQKKKHVNLSPSKLWEGEAEYKEFPLEIFRKHIYQEVISQSGRSYWMNKKRMKQDKKRRKIWNQRNRMLVKLIITLSRSRN